MRTFISGLLGATTLAAGLTGAPILAQDITITMAAPDWPPLPQKGRRRRAGLQKPPG